MLLGLVALTLLGLCTLGPVVASSGGGRDHSEQRGDFLAAERALKRGDDAGFLALSGRLRDYPLYPYLRYWELRERLDGVRASEVAEFLEAYADTPVAESLRTDWLSELARQQRWREYLTYYRDGGTTTQACYQRQALLNTGRDREALVGAERLWLTGHSLPKACDPILAAWRSAGRLGTELVWQRIALAMDAGETELAAYLGRFLPSADLARLELWRRLHQQPSLLLDEPLPEGHDGPLRDLIIDALRQLGRRDAASAAEVWERLRDRHGFTPEQVLTVERRLALGMAIQRQPGARRWLDRVADRDQTVAQWAVRAAVLAGDWAQVLRGLSRLEPEPQAEEPWQYWHARALEETGKRAEAETLYAKLAQGRSYYGFLAADKLRTRYQLNDRPLTFDAQELQALAQRPGMLRAQEWYRLGRMVEARREWRHSTRGLDAADLARAAKLAQQWGWYDRAIITSAQSGEWDDLDLRFPVLYRDAVLSQARANRIDPAWVFATVRQESAFTRDVRSSAGAIGLMQLMPATARQVAHQLRDPPPSTTDLLEPATNIRLGAAYLRRVLDANDDNPVLASAAYNAGPNRVRRWRPAETPLPADRWVEAVPFNETRDYLRRVLAYSVIYEQRLGNRKTRLQQRMPAVAAE